MSELSSKGTSGFIGAAGARFEFKSCPTCGYRPGDDRLREAAQAVVEQADRVRDRHGAVNGSALRRRLEAEIETLRAALAPATEEEETKANG
jgi:hypothetical protein